MAEPAQNDSVDSRSAAQWAADLRRWDAVATLTFDPRRLQSLPSGFAARKMVAAWLRRAESVYRRPIGALIAMEYHRNGWPHFHALLGADPQLRLDELLVLAATWQAWHGFARVERPRDVADAAAYAAKYLVKDLHKGDLFVWPPKGSPARPSRPPRRYGGHPQPRGSERGQRGPAAGSTFQSSDRSSSI